MLHVLLTAGCSVTPGEVKSFRENLSSPASPMQSYMASAVPKSSSLVYALVVTIHLQGREVCPINALLNMKSLEAEGL